MIKKVKTKDLHSQNIIIENQDDKVDIKFPIKYQLIIIMLKHLCFKLLNLYLKKS